MQASEADLEADEYSDAMFAMNNYMESLSAQGINMGYTEVSNLSDAVTIPTGALRGLIANLAIEIAPDYNGVISQGLAQAAKDGFDAMQELGINIVSTYNPPTLPIGSGNTSTPGWDDNYYADNEDEILAETSGAIGLETGTT